MTRRVSFVALTAALLGLLGTACDRCSDGAGGEADESTPTASEPPPDAGSLPAPSEFASIEAEAKRSRRIFEAIGEVLLHPRCVNCHPAGERPLMGDQSRPHQPLVTRGGGGMGTPGMRCTSCHGRDNFQNVPGRPGWRMAPKSMSWEGESLGAICRQIKDPERNGGMSLDELVDHMAEDHLVAYGWEPPAQYERVPGTQEQFGELARAWVDSGAHCPEQKESK